MKIERLDLLKKAVRQVQLLAEQQVVQYDRGPESTPSPELIRALAMTTSCSVAMSIIHQEQFEVLGDVAWLKTPGVG